MADGFDRRVTRRQFSISAGCAFASVMSAGACGAETPSPGDENARLRVRARKGVATTARNGALELGEERDAILQLPSTAADRPLPLLVLLHGAGGSGGGILRRVAAGADEAGVAVLAPDSRGTTWDAIRERFGPDVAFINRALETVFDRVSVDPARVSIGGFSDGASSALSLGLANGDLFSRVVAFSPGFVVSAAAQGRPRVFVSHGRNDPILPIDACSRVIVPRLQSMGHDVVFREFDGRHEVPPEIAREAMRWLAGGPPAQAR
jgi:phospholipase/carboxylesterase